MKSLLLLILIAFCEHQTYAQTKMRPFRLNGIIQADTGTIRLIPTGGKEYGLAREDVYETKIYNGKFAFTGKIAYPSSHLLLLPPSYLSGHFMIDPGVQTIKCNIDSMRVIPYVDNKTMQQERAIFYKTPAALLAYTKQHPDS